MLQLELANPSALLVLAVVPALAWLTYRRSAAGYRFASTAALIAVRPTLRLRLARLLPFLRLVAVACFAVALAGPRRTDANAVVHAPGIDITLSMDLSSSMESQWAQGKTRLEGSRAVSEAFINGRPNDRIGLVVFQRDSLALAPPTLDHGALTKMVTSLESGLLPDGTGIGVGLAEAINLLRDSTSASRVVIVLTDGQQNADSISPEDAAQLGTALHIKVYAIGVVTQGAQGEVDRERLTKIAEGTGGKYFEATNPKALADIYDTIGKLETSSLERDRFERFVEFGPWLSAAGAVLLITELVLRGTWLRRSPG